MGCAATGVAESVATDSAAAATSSTSSVQRREVEGDADLRAMLVFLLSCFLLSFFLFDENGGLCGVEREKREREK